MQPVIRVENLSKRYRLGLTHAGSVRELVNQAVARFRGQRGAQPKEAGVDHVWALRDVSFEVNPGEVLGIIGRNGAGKSTLLKILSRITAPTDGRVEMRGRVASLLEVGTGFHPELTGRENVYMNGTILGMKRTEIDRHFDSIVDFAGVETFIDTPVKRYSSGMTVRLGFAVAAHMSPEILIIDEVLAVGDAEFQKRCVGAMDGVAKSGRTVLFVSHNMASIRQLARRSILIEKGELLSDGDTEEVLTHYLSRPRSNQSNPEAIGNMERLDWSGDRTIEFSSAELMGLPLTNSDSELRLRIGVRTSLLQVKARFCCTLFAFGGAPVGSAFSRAFEITENAGLVEQEYSLGIRDLAPGSYWFRVGLVNERNQVTDAVDEVLGFTVPQDRNMPDGFVDWLSGWGNFRLEIRNCRRTRITE